MSDDSPGPPPDPPDQRVLGPDPKKQCSSCGLRGHPSNFSEYCPQSRKIKARGRDYGPNGEYGYRDFVWKCSFNRFCRNPVVGQTLLSVVEVVSRARFEASRFLQLFLASVQPEELINDPIKDSKIDNLLKAFFKPSDNAFAEPRKCFHMFHPRAASLFTESYAPTRGTAIWPGDAPATRSLSNELIFRVTQSVRNQFASAWKRHVVYNIGGWTVSWIKDQMALELREAWTNMKSWQRTKLAWCIYSYVTMGESDGVDFAKRAKVEAAKAKKRKRKANSDDEEEEVPSAPARPVVPDPFKLPALRTAQWPEGAYEAALMVIEEVKHRLGPVDISSKKSGGIVLGNANVSYTWFNNQFEWLRYLSRLWEADDNHRKFALCPLYDWKRAYVNFDTTTLFAVLDLVREAVTKDPDAPPLPRNLAAFNGNQDTIEAWNDYLFRLSPNQHRKRNHDKPFLPYSSPHPEQRNWLYSCSFQTDACGTSVLCAKRYLKKGDSDDEPSTEDDLLDPNRKSKRTGTGAFVGDVDHISDALKERFAFLPDDTPFVPIDPGVKRPATGVRTTLGDLRANGRMENETHPLVGLDNLPAFEVSAGNVRKHTKAKRRADETLEKITAALGGNREALNAMGTPKTCNVTQLETHLTKVFALLNDIWTVTLSDGVAKRRWQSYIASQRFYAKTIPRWILGADRLHKPCVVAFGAASFSTVRKGTMPVSVRKIRRALVHHMDPRKDQFFIDVGEDYSSQTCSTAHALEFPGRTLVAIKHAQDTTPKKTHGLQLCHSEEEFCCGRHWARDVNSARNLLVIFLFLLVYGHRPECYTREYWEANEP